METTTEKPKRIKEVVVVLELTEQPTSPVFPVPGADGSEIGLMTFCPIRNRHCLRMSVEVFRRHKENLFTARRRFFHLIPDLEFVYEDQTLVPALEARVAELETALAKAKSSKKTVRPRRRKPVHKEPIEQ